MNPPDYDAYHAGIIFRPTSWGQNAAKSAGAPTSEIFCQGPPTCSETSQTNFQPGRTIGRYRNIIYIAGTTEVLAKVAIGPIWPRPWTEGTIETSGPSSCNFRHV
jgi:hypothetical protein